MGAEHRSSPDIAYLRIQKRPECKIPVNKENYAEEILAQRMRILTEINNLYPNRIFGRREASQALESKFERTVLHECLNQLIIDGYLKKEFEKGRTYSYQRTEKLVPKK